MAVFILRALEGPADVPPPCVGISTTSRVRHFGRRTRSRTCTPWNHDGVLADAASVSPRDLTNRAQMSAFHRDAEIAASHDGHRKRGSEILAELHHRYRRLPHEAIDDLVVEPRVKRYDDNRRALRCCALRDRSHQSAHPLVLRNGALPRHDDDPDQRPVERESRRFEDCAHRFFAGRLQHERGVARDRHPRRVDTNPLEFRTTNCDRARSRRRRLQSSHARCFLQIRTAGGRRRSRRS